MGSWCRVPGKYTTSMKIQHAAGTEVITLELTLQDLPPAIRDIDIYKMERLRWLNSMTGIDRSVTYEVMEA